MTHLRAIYRVRSNVSSIEARALAIAIEQSVEMPLAAIHDSHILAEIVGQVAGIAPCDDGLYEVAIDLATATVGDDAGQLINMLFGNTSLQDDVILHDAILPADLLAAFGGPRHGLAGMRSRVGAHGRALSCSALKPQGMAPAALATLTGRLAQGRLDYVKDDHGLADQAYSPFADRVAACAAAVRAATQVSGHPTRYVPSLSGHLDQLRQHIDTAVAYGIDTVMAAPMVIGLAAFRQIVVEYPNVAFVAHPAMAGAARIAPSFLLGKLFPLLGADAVIFPNSGGRFGYSTETCVALADAVRTPPMGQHAGVPVPAGGMSLDRVGEMLQMYGIDVMLLIGGALLAVGEAELVTAAADFAAAVAEHKA